MYTHHEIYHKKEKKNTIDHTKCITTMFSPWLQSIHLHYAAYGPTHNLTYLRPRTTVWCRLLFLNTVLNLTVSYSLIFPLSLNWTNRRLIELCLVRVWQSENRLAAWLTTTSFFLYSSLWKTLTQKNERYWQLKSQNNIYNLYTIRMN